MLKRAYPFLTDGSNPSMRQAAGERSKAGGLARGQQAQPLSGEAASSTIHRRTANGLRGFRFRWRREVVAVRWLSSTTEATKVNRDYA
jgi:hypothetical protein